MSKDVKKKSNRDRDRVKERKMAKMERPTNSKTNKNRQTRRFKSCESQ